jgi:hypothetical protein
MPKGASVVCSTALLSDARSFAGRRRFAPVNVGKGSSAEAGPVRRLVALRQKADCRRTARASCPAPVEHLFPVTKPTHVTFPAESADSRKNGPSAVEIHTESASVCSESADSICASSFYEAPGRGADW